MTTTVKVSAHCSANVEVQILLNNAVIQVLQNGEETAVYAYDNRVITVKEVSKSKEKRNGS